MRRAALVLALLATIACTTASSVTPSSPNAPAGVDGEVSYCAGGAKAVRDARREDAYKKMRAHCNGEYTIVDEQDERGAICPSQRRITFKCAT